jgi:hypothetical protein
MDLTMRFADQRGMRPQDIRIARVQTQRDLDSVWVILYRSQPPSQASGEASWTARA